MRNSNMGDIDGDVAPVAQDKANASSQGGTVEKVEEAALQLLAQEGVLAGLNLNEVAKHAGINRGLVYHHFGSRRGLLRSAIRRRMSKENAAWNTPSEPLPLGERVAHAVSATIESRETLKLTTLLHLDGSTAPKLMPNAEKTLLLLERDRALGLTPMSEDLLALHAAYAAASYGYAVYREIFARDLNIPVEDLDQRVISIFRTLFNKAPDPGPRRKSKKKKL